MKKERLLAFVLNAMGMLFLVFLWSFLSYGVGVSHRYLPSPDLVLSAFGDIDPPLYVHAAATIARIVVGTVTGVVCGVGLALLIEASVPLRRLLLPSILMLRAIPPIATVPFFLLWFGFSEWGKFLLVAIGVGLNIVVAAIQILENMDERFVVALGSFQKSLRCYPFSVALPLVLESLLPTLRTSVAIIFGTVIVSELLGSQMGLGYLIQTSRTTYSMHVVFLVTIILGVLATLLDQAVILLWKKTVFWKHDAD